MRLSLHEYFPFGEEATTSTGTFPLRFTGHERDFFASGGATPNQDDLDYMHARFHSPVTARFLSVDPIGGDLRLPQSWNRYAYVLGNPLKYVDPYGLRAAEVICDADGCTVTVIGEDPDKVNLAFLLQFEQFRLEFAAFKEYSLSRRERFRDLDYRDMSFQQHVDLGVLMGQGGDCADPNCLMMAQVVYDFENSALLWTIGGSQAAGLGFMGAGEAASVAGPAAANAGLGPGRFLFGRGGLLNSNGYLRIGESAHRGHRYFSIRGQAIDRLTGTKGKHIDLWRLR